MSESAELTQVSATGILGAFEPWRKEVGAKETENSELRDSQLCEDQSICRHLMPSWTGYSLHFNLIIKKICNYLCYWSAANFIEVIIECHDLMLSVSWSHHLASIWVHFSFPRVYHFCSHITTLSLKSTEVLNLWSTGIMSKHAMLSHHCTATL